MIDSQCFCNFPLPKNTYFSDLIIYPKASSKAIVEVEREANLHIIAIILSQTPHKNLVKSLFCLLTNGTNRDIRNAQLYTYITLQFIL